MLPLSNELKCLNIAMHILYVQLLISCKVLSISNDACCLVITVGFQLCAKRYG